MQLADVITKMVAGAAVVDRPSYTPPYNSWISAMPSTPIQTMPQPANDARRCLCGARPKPDGSLPCDH